MHIMALIFEETELIAYEVRQYEIDIDYVEDIHNVRKLSVC